MRRILELQVLECPGKGNLEYFESGGKEQRMQDSSADFIPPIAFRYIILSGSAVQLRLFFPVMRLQ